MTIKCRFFIIIAGRAYWLRGMPLGIRVMWRPQPELAPGGVQHTRHPEIACAWDGWVWLDKTGWGWRVNQRRYQLV